MHAEDGTELMQRADTAMYAAKASHLGVLVYDPCDDGNSTDRLHAARRPSERARDHQLSIHYQPKIDLRTDQSLGWRRCSRWQHPDPGKHPAERLHPPGRDAPG